MGMDVSKDSLTRHGMGEMQMTVLVSMLVMNISKLGRYSVYKYTQITETTQFSDA